MSTRLFTDCIPIVYRLYTRLYLNCFWAVYLTAVKSDSGVFLSTYIDIGNDPPG